MHLIRLVLRVKYLCILCFIYRHTGDQLKRSSVDETTFVNRHINLMVCWKWKQIRFFSFVYWSNVSSLIIVDDTRRAFLHELWAGILISRALMTVNNSVAGVSWDVLLKTRSSTRFKPSGWKVDPPTSVNIYNLQLTFPKFKTEKTNAQLHASVITKLKPYLFHFVWLFSSCILDLPFTKRFAAYQNNCIFKQFDRQL